MGSRKTFSWLLRLPTCQGQYGLWRSFVRNLLALRAFLCGLDYILLRAVPDSLKRFHFYWNLHSVWAKFLLRAEPALVEPFHFGQAETKLKPKPKPKPKLKQKPKPKPDSRDNPEERSEGDPRKANLRGREENKVNKTNSFTTFQGVILFTVIKTMQKYCAGFFAVFFVLKKICWLLAAGISPPPFFLKPFGNETKNQSSDSLSPLENFQNKIVRIF